jgi:hypothetical protein
MADHGMRKAGRVAYRVVWRVSGARFPYVGSITFSITGW